MTQGNSHPDLFTIDRCRELLVQLIEIDTCQPEGNESRLVDFIETRYKNTHAICTRIEHGSNRASLVVKLPGQQDAGAIAFIGHLDTVACGDLTQWSSPPLAGTVRGDILVGRGAADMKGGVAAMLLTLDYYLENDQNLKRSVLSCFTADEEKDGLGVRAMLESGLLRNIGGVIVCEPTLDAIGLSEKGALWVRVSVSGVSCHASRPELGRNAIEALLAFAFRARSAIDFSQEHPFLGKNTLSITKIHGGVMTNMIPSSATGEFDLRTLPGISHEEIYTKLAGICQEIEMAMKPLTLELEIINDRPALEMDTMDDFVVNIQASAQKRGIQLGKRGLFYYTDASQLIPALDVPFVILGPGNDQEAHKTNEQVELSSIARFARLYAGFIEDQCQ